MAKVRRVIRKIDPAATRSFDDQFWPIVVALFVLGGFAAGLIFAYLTDHFMFWPSLILLPVVIGLTIATLRYIGNRFIKRSMQLALVISVIIHLVILVSTQQEVFEKRMQVTEEMSDLVRPRQIEVTIPQYTQLPSWSREKPDFQRMVQTTTPEPAPQQIKIKKEQLAPQEPMHQPQPTPVPKPEKTVQPNVVPKQQLSQSAPRQSEQSSKLSRQLTRAELRSGRAAQVPQVANNPTRPMVNPRSVQVQRQPARQPSVQRPAVQQPAVTVRSRSVQLARRVPQVEPKVQTARAPTLARKTARPQMTPRSAVASTAVPSQPRKTQQAITPAPVAQRKQTVSPTIEPQEAEPTLQPVRVAERPRPRQQRTARQPAIAQTPRSVDNRRVRTTTRPNINAVAQLANPTAADRRSLKQPTPLEAQTSPTRQPQQRLPAAVAARPSPAEPAPGAQRAARAIAAADRPAARRLPWADRAPQVAQSSQSADRKRTDTSRLPAAVTNIAAAGSNAAPLEAARPVPRPSAAVVSRQPLSDPAATRSQQRLPAQQTSPRTQVASVNRRRSQPAQMPSLRAESAPAPLVARSINVAPSAASPTAVESPAVAVVSRGAGNPSVEPARTAVAKSLAGTAGIGRSENVDRALPAGLSPALVASNAANRPRTIQNTPEGPALSPSQPARIGRSVTDLQVPSASVAATEPRVATRPGAQQPSPLNATASAAITQASSDADRGPISAAKGTAEVDLGPPKVIAESGAGRAAGGGQPMVSFQQQSRGLARTETGGAPQMALATTTQAALPQAPAATGGGGPPTAETQPDASAVVRMESGGQQPVSGGPSAAVMQGPAEQLSTAEQLAEASVSRSQAAEAAPGTERAGGGQPELDEEEEKVRQLARSKLAGSPQLPLAATQAAAAGQAEGSGEGGGQAPGQAPEPAVVVARAEQPASASAGSGPSAKALEGPPATPGGGERIAKMQLGRAEAVEAATGQPVIGGGTASRSSSVASVAIASSTRAEMPQIGGRPQSSGSASHQPVLAQGAELTRATGGATGPVVSGPVGAVTGQSAVAATSGTVAGMAAGVRRAAPASTEGPILMARANTGAPLPRSQAVQLPMGADREVANVLPQPGGEGSGAPTGPQPTVGLDVGPLSRQATGGLVANLPVPDGPGGLALDYALDAGLGNRRARPDSELVQPIVTSRFKRSDPGGKLATSTAALFAKDAYRGRQHDRKGSRGQGQPSPQTERAIELGLVFLERHQSPDGSWSFSHFGAGRRGYEQEQAALSSDTAATGLALLAFQGAGYDHTRDKYGAAVSQGIDWLLKNQKPDGDLYVKMDKVSHASVWLYSHGIATLALCEAYGMTQDPRLREPAQRAIDFIVQSQNKELGGWRYSPRRSSDTSVTGWMMMALYSGQLAGLEVPQETYDRITHWLDLAQKSTTERHLYCYNPLAPDTPQQRHGRRPSKTDTAVGLLMRLYTGWRRDNAHMIRGAEYLLQNLPSYGSRRDPQRDTYYWYYATQVMLHMGGRYWQQWEAKLHPLLVSTQTQSGPMAGSWNPRSPIPDRWGPHAGRLYVTTMNLLSLEVQYRILPLYEQTAK